MTLIERALPEGIAAVSFRRDGELFVVVNPVVPITARAGISDRCLSGERVVLIKGASRPTPPVL